MSGWTGGAGTPAAPLRAALRIRDVRERTGSGWRGMLKSGVTRRPVPDPYRGLRSFRCPRLLLLRLAPRRGRVPGSVGVFAYFGDWRARRDSNSRPPGS